MMSYTEILDFLNIVRPKCRCCGEDILYDNTIIKSKTLKNGKIRITGTSYQSTKEVNGHVYSLEVCQKCLLKNFPNISNPCRTYHVMSEPTKFAFNISDEDYIVARNNYAMTKNKMINKYGEDEGNKRWDDYCKKQSETNTFEYKQKTYGWTEEEFKKFNKSRAVTLKNLINKYGEDEGNKRWEDYCKKQSETKSWDYMVEKHGLEKARQINKSKALTLENYINRLGEEKGKIEWLKYINNCKFGYSETSQILFRNLDKYLENKYTTYFATKNGEYTITNHGSSYHLDYFIEELNICIEYNGGCFHGDERIYEDNEYCNPFDKSLTAKELREKDKERYEYLYKNYGIKTFVIWELDYNPNNFDYINYIKNTLKIDIND